MWKMKYLIWVIHLGKRQQCVLFLMVIVSEPGKLEEKKNQVMKITNQLVKVQRLVVAMEERMWMRKGQQRRMASWCLSNILQTNLQNCAKWVKKSKLPTNVKNVVNSFTEGKIACILDLCVSSAMVLVTIQRKSNQSKEVRAFGHFVLINLQDLWV